MPRLLYRFSDYRIDPSAREITRAGELQAVSPPVFDCIAYLIEHRERAVGRDELISAVWGRAEIKDDLLAQTLVRARRAVGDSGNEQRAIRTIPRFGYRWIAAIEVDDDGHDGPAEAGARTGAAPAPETVEMPAAAPKRAWRPRLIVATALLLAVIALGVVVAPRLRQQAPVAAVSTAATTASAGEVFLVLPVRVAEAARETAWIRLGGMDYIATTLREQGHLRVLPSDAVLTLIGQHEPSTADSGEWQRLQSAAGAAYLVTPRATPTSRGWRLVLDVYHDGHRASYAADGANPLEASARAASMFLGGLGLPSHADEADTTPAIEQAQRIGAALLAGDLPEARRVAEQVPEALRQTPEVRLMIGKVAYRGGHVDEAQAIFAPLAADATLSPANRAWAQIGLGAVAVRREDFDAVEREYGAAIATLGDHADPYLLGLAYIGRGIAHGGRGDTESALSDLGRARVEMERAGNRISIADIDIDVALVEANRGRHAEAIAIYDRAIAALAEFGARDHLATALLDKATSQLALLDLDGALATSGRSWDIARTLENRSVVHRSAAVRARALLAGGQLGAAAELLDPADRSAPAEEDAELAVLRARLAFERGDATAAAKLAGDQIDRLGTVAAAAGASADAVELALLSLDVARATGDAAPVQRLVERMRASARPADGARRATVLQLATAELRDAAHDSGAASTYADALDAADRGGAPDLIVAVAAAELNYLIAHGSLDAAMTVLGRLSAYTATDYTAASAAAAVYRARGERALAQASEARVRALAGERAVPPAR